MTLKKNKVTQGIYKDGDFLERAETFQIYLKFDIVKLNKKERKILETLFSPLIIFNDGDTAVITYHFDIEYFNGVASKLSAILDLFDKATVKKVKTEELLSGKSLIQEILARLEQVEKKFKLS